MGPELMSVQLTAQRSRGVAALGGNACRPISARMEDLTAERRVADKSPPEEVPGAVGAWLGRDGKCRGFPKARPIGGRAPANYSLGEEMENQVLLSSRQTEIATLIASIGMKAADFEWEEVIGLGRGDLVSSLRHMPSGGYMLFDRHRRGGFQLEFSPGAQARIEKWFQSSRGEVLDWPDAIRATSTWLSAIQTESMQRAGGGIASSSKPAREQDNGSEVNTGPETSGLLEDFVRQGRKLAECADGPARAHSLHESWVGDVSDWLDLEAPGTGLSAKWVALGASPLVLGGRNYDEPHAWASYQGLLRKRIGWLSQNGPRVANRTMSSLESETWKLLHPSVKRVSERRFLDGHFADAVEAALKELNGEVKRLVLEGGGPELDGANLMHTAFSPNNPLIELADISTLSGKSEQQGYMEIFAGAMSGVRNPKAHENIYLTPERGLHFLFLASLLFQKLDERR